VRSSMLSSGTTLNNRYTIESTLARGGMSVLYLASDSHLPGRWVIKEMGDVFPNEDDRLAILEHFRREVAILSMLNHQGLPKITDFFESGGKRYLVEEFIEGITLQQRVAEGVYAEDRAIETGAALLAILEYLHGNGIIYRDLKPHNIMICPDGSCRLIDFGIARLYSIGKRRDTVLMGTPGFAAPEHYGNRQTDERSDIYSLGATLHFMVTGREPSLSPFSFEAPHLLNPSVSQWLSDIIMTALEARQEDRFSSAEEMRKTLTGPKGVPIKAREYSYPGRHSHFFTRRGIFYSGITLTSFIAFIASLGTQNISVIFGAGLLTAWIAERCGPYFENFRKKFTATSQDLIVTQPPHSVRIPWSSIVALRIRKHQSFIPWRKKGSSADVADSALYIEAFDVLYRFDQPQRAGEGFLAVPSYDFFDDHRAREEKGFQCLTFSSLLRGCEELFRTIVARARLKSSEEPGSCYVDEVYFR